MRSNTEVRFPRKRRNSSLNEALFQKSNMDVDKKLDTVGSGTPTYAAALNDHKDRMDNLEKVTKQHRDEIDKIISDINADDKDAEDKGVKKASLNESLFEAYVDTALAKRAQTAANELRDLVTNINRVDDLHTFASEKDLKIVEKAAEVLDAFFEAYNYVVVGESLTEETAVLDRPATAGVRTFVKTQDEADAWRLKQLFKSFKDSGDAVAAEAEFRASHGVPEGEEIIADDLRADEFPIPSNWEVLDAADYSVNDPWLAVYDELSNDIDQEAPGVKQQVDKKLPAKRHERYNDVRPYGDNDIIVYTDSLKKLDFAKKVADYYADLGVVAEEPVEHKSRYVPDNQRWSMVFRIPEKQ